MTIITASSAPPHHLLRALGDPNGPFVGSWTYEISPADAGSKVVLTEVAGFNNSLFRVMTRIFGQSKYMDEHLEDLAKEFGETATVMFLARLAAVCRPAGAGPGTDFPPQPRPPARLWSRPNTPRRSCAPRF